MDEPRRVEGSADKLGLAFGCASGEDGRLERVFAAPRVKLIYSRWPGSAMPGRPPGVSNGDEILGRLLRRAREPFASHAELAGFSVAVATLVRSARHLIESSPEISGSIAALGIREEGTLWFVGEAAEAARSAMGYDPRTLPEPSAALIPARVFTVVAYGHPFFDGNKRTAFLAATLLGYYMGFETRFLPYAARP